MLQILDITSNKNKLIIYGVGGQSQQYNNFWPYLYVHPKQNKLHDVLDRIHMHMDITKVEIVERYLPLGYQEKKEKMIKVYTDDPKNIRSLREELKSEDVLDIYEADILYKNRFMIDMGIGGMAWIDEKCHRTNNSANAEMKILSIDFEMLPPTDGRMPDSSKDQIIVASLAFMPKHFSMETLVLVASPNVPEEKDVIGFNNERELLQHLNMLVEDYNPDIITGYNINEFDFPYLTGRYANNHLNNTWGRNQSQIYIKSLIDRKNISITGRVVLDLLPLIRKNYSYQNYTLRTVAHELLKWEKLDLNMQDMRTFWIANNQQSLKEICDYARRDAHLVLKLLEKTKLLDRFVAISSKTGLLLQDCIDGGQTGKIDMLIMKEFKKIDRVMGSKPAIEEDESDEVKYEGAVILEPVRGYLKDIVVCDYRSLYPTIMISQNYSPDSIILDEEYLKHPHHKAVVGGTFISKDIYDGVVPKILSELLNGRMAIKKEMKNHSKDTDSYDFLDAQQYAIKILLNSFYGYTGYTRSRLYLLDIAEAVTSFGRKNILDTKDMINNFGKLIKMGGKIYARNDITNIDYNDDSIDYFNVRVVYGDTDSLFIEVKQNFVEYGKMELDDIKLVGEFIAQKATDRLPEPMALLYEKIAKRIIFEQKKKYAYLRYDKGKDGWKSEIATMGMETKRRDSCPIVADTLKTCIKMVLEDDNLGGAVEHASNAIKEIINKSEFKSIEDISDLIITRKFTKNSNLYKVQQVHIKVAKKIMDRGIHLNLGDRIQYLIYQGRQEKASDRADTPEYIMEKGLKLDTKYYIEKQLFPPLKRFFNCFGITDNDIWKDAPRVKKTHSRIHKTENNYKQLSLGNWG